MPEKGNIFTLLEKALIFIKEHMVWVASFVGLNRIETPEIPIDALREIIVNSFAHADYTNYGNNIEHEIAIYNDKIVVFNPGSFPKDIKPEDYINGRVSSLIKNQLVCNALYISNQIDKWGTGIQKSYKLCKDNKTNISFNNSYMGFECVFERKNILLKTNIDDPVKKQIINILSNNPNGTIDDLSKTLNISLRKAKYLIKLLVEEGLIVRVGSKKTGVWKINSRD